MNKPEAQLLMALHLNELGVEFREEYRFHPSRKWAFDFYFIHNPGQSVAIEIEGGVHQFRDKRTGKLITGHHHHQKGFESDIEKYNEAAALQIRVFRFTTKQVLRGEAKEFMRTRVLEL